MNSSTQSKNVTTILLWVYFLLVFSVYPTVIPYRSVLTTIIIIAAYFSMSYFKIYRKNTAFIKCLILILAADAISAVYIRNTVTTHVVYAIHYIFLILTVSNYCKLKKDYTSICRIVFWPSFIGGPIIGLFQMITGRYVFAAQDSDNSFLRTIISDVRHGNANYTAVSMLFCVILALYLYKKTKKETYRFATLISIICVILTFSRTTIAVLLFGMFIYFVNAIHQSAKMELKIKKRTIVFLSIIFVVGLYFCFSPNSIVARYLSSADIDLVIKHKTGSTSELRTNQWVASIQVMMNNGIGHFLFGFSDSAPSAMGKLTGYSMTSHNFIFGRASENGVIAFFAAAILYLSFFINTVKKWKLLKGRDEAVIVLGSCAILLCYLMISITGWELLIILTVSNLVFNGTDLKLENKRKCH